MLPRLPGLAIFTRAYRETDEPAPPEEPPGRRVVGNRPRCPCSVRFGSFHVGMAPSRVTCCFEFGTPTSIPPAGRVSYSGALWCVPLSLYVTSYVPSL